VIVDGELAGLIACATSRGGCRAAIAELKALGLRSVMLTGDNARTGDGHRGRSAWPQGRADARRQGRGDQGLRRKPR
jgi:hypothetical protein